MPDFDVQQIRGKTADAIALSVLPSYYTAADREMVLNLPTIADDHRARAALAVIVPAVTEQIRALHQPNPGCSFTPWNGEKVEFDGCKTCGAVRYPCPTLRLCDELDAAARGEQS